MAKKYYLYLYLTVIVFSDLLALRALAFTDPLDVAVLEDLFKALNNPEQLNNWKFDGGDPCAEPWTGVSCSGSSVIYLNLQGLGLNGQLGGRLYDLHNLKHLDVSFNNIVGEIPEGLPCNVTHINMAFNKLSKNIPHSLPTLKHLRHLNLSHNLLSGPVGNVFTGLQNLIELDLSYNDFTGDLPSSFGSLKNLTGLFLQNNNFTGSVIYLADLHLLTSLNIEDNQFSGVIPKKFQSIANLWFWGNKFHVDADSPPWNFPMDSLPLQRNFTVPPTTQSSAVENYPSSEINQKYKKGISPGGVASLVFGLALGATCAAVFIAFRINRARAEGRNNLESANSARHSLQVSTAREYSSTAPEEGSHMIALSSPFFLGPKRVPPVRSVRTEATSRRKSISKRCKPACVAYNVAELQLATNSFSEDNLLGHGSLGSVYKAEFPDGQILAVKNINLASLSFDEEEQFMDVIRISSQFRHPNIVKLLGYCVEYGQHLLVYEYVRNLSLADALHREIYKPLSWGIRLHIALGIAQALHYLHSQFFPPVSHCNIKAANILLDEGLVPRVCDSGLAVLRPLTSASVKLKASEIAIGNSAYVALEHWEPGSDNTKGDIYAFGVLLLELLTGKTPIDNSRPRLEQSLVKWASSRLHDRESLEQMVDRGIKGTFSSRDLSQFADIISLCIQPEKEFRSPMSEIVDFLSRLVQKQSMLKTNGAADCPEVDPFERSFRSTRTRFMNSPTVSYISN